MKLNEVLKTMFTQTGVNVSDATITKILDNPAFTSIEVDEAVSKQLLAERFSLDAAKNNPELAKHFKALTLNGVDAEVYRNADEFGFDETDKTELKSAESSFKRMSIAMKKIESLTNKKASATSGGKDKLDAEILKLNTELLNIKTEHAKALSDKEIGFTKERTDWQLDSVYNNFISKMDEKYDAETNRIIAKTKVNSELAKKGLKVINKDGNLSLATVTDTDYFENNQKVELNDFVSKTLANAKLLNASAPARQMQQRTQTQTQHIENPNGLRTDKATAELAAMLEEG